jgi:putative transposase
LNEVFVNINTEPHYLWGLWITKWKSWKAFVTKRRDRNAAVKFIRQTMKHDGCAHIFVTNTLSSYGAAMKVIGNVDKQETGRWLNNRAENSQVRFQSARSIN